MRTMNNYHHDAMDQEPAYRPLSHEIGAAEAGLVYAQGFYPRTSIRHFPDEDWNTLNPPYGNKFAPPEWMREGYKRYDVKKPALQRSYSAP